MIISGLIYSRFNLNWCLISGQFSSDCCILLGNFVKVVTQRVQLVQAEWTKPHFYCLQYWYLSFKTIHNSSWERSKDHTVSSFHLNITNLQWHWCDGLLFWKVVKFYSYLYRVLIRHVLLSPPLNRCLILTTCCTSPTSFTSTTFPLQSQRSVPQ